MDDDLSGVSSETQQTNSARNNNTHGMSLFGKKNTSTINWQKEVAIGDKMYRIKNDRDLYISTDEGKCWNFVTSLPIYSSLGVCVTEDGKLAIGGQYKKKEDIRAFRVDDKGALYVAKHEDELNDFEPVPFIEQKMVIGSDSYTSELKDDLKAQGLKDSEKAEITIRCYERQTTVMFSMNGVCWHKLDGELPEEEMVFNTYREIVVAEGRTGKNYFYFKKHWMAIDFEADQEFCKDDAPNAYKHLQVDEMKYNFYSNNDDSCQDVKTKTAHLFISNKTQSTNTKICYIANDYVREDEFNNFDNEISEVENLHNEVTIVCKKGTEVNRYVFVRKGWEKTYNENIIIKDDFDYNYYYGPYCFKAIILDNDPFWEDVDSPIKEYPLDAKGKEIARTREIILKFPRGSWDWFFYLDKSGNWAPHSTGHSNPYQTLVCSGRPVPVTNKKGEISHYTIDPITYHSSNNRVLGWIRKKKGLILKEYVYEWEAIEDIRKEMLGKK